MIAILLATSLFVTDNATATPTPAPTPAGDGLIHLEVKPEMVDLVPTFPVASLPRAVDFYKKLGFGVILQSGSYVAVGRDLIQIGLVADRNAPKGYKQSSYIRMAHIEPFYKEVVGKGVKPTTELKLQPSQMKEFSVTDPDGNVLIFGEYVGR